MAEEIKKDEVAKEPEGVFEVPSDVEAIRAATDAYSLVAEIDDKMLDKTGQRRLARIKNNSLYIIDKALIYLMEPYMKEDEDE